MSAAPWSKEQSEQWAQDAANLAWKMASYIPDDYESGFLAGLAKAAEIIEAGPTVYGKTKHPWERVESRNFFRVPTDTHQAKLVGVKRIDSISEVIKALDGVPARNEREG